METLWITKTLGQITDSSKATLRRFFEGLKDGSYQITGSLISYNTKRYKFYFGHVLPKAVYEFNKKGVFQVIDEDGQITPLTVDHLHIVLKDIFCKQELILDGELIRCKGSTKVLTDNQFINYYEMPIIEWLWERDVEIMSRNEWNEEMKSGKTSYEIIEYNEQH